MKNDVAALVLTGDDPKLLRRIARLKKQRENEENKAQRQRDKDEAESKARARANRPVTVLTVKHQPTYCCLSYKRADGLKENRKPPAAFQVKNEVQSIKSQTRLKNAINWMLMFADRKHVHEKATGRNYSYRLGFMTLTLSAKQMHTDEFIKEHMLQPFLYWLTRYYSSLYVWKAESQLNGNIHFHLTIDTFVPKNSIRAKWNKLLAKHGYCKVFQDGSNDKGNAATQIKCVLSEKKCAADIGGYMSKKDRVAKKDIEAIKNKRAGYEDSNVHCKFNPDLPTANQDHTWYKRVIDGRLWGCSEGLSNINIFIDETFSEFQKEEKIFFRQNDDIYNLGKHITERAVMGITDEDIERKNRFMENVFIHKHINQMKMGGKLQQLIHEEKMKRKKNFQKYFTDN
jgi:hypothetical protein